MVCPPFWIIVSKLVLYTLKPVWPVLNKICPPFWIIKFNQSQTSLCGLTVLPDWFSAKSLFSLYLCAISPGWLHWAVRSLHYNTHISLKKSWNIQYMYNIILPPNFPHIHLQDLHLIKPHRTSSYTYTACISLSLLINSVITTSCRTKWSILLRYTTLVRHCS